MSARAGIRNAKSACAVGAGCPSRRRKPRRFQITGEETSPLRIENEISRFARNDRGAVNRCFPNAFV